MYTREAGVRTLEREIAKLCRKALRQILEKKVDSVTITPANIAEFAGVQKYRHGLSETENQIGAVTGLAWTEVGGELLTIESVTVAGKGQAKLTGKLGDVMKESIETAMSFVKARAPSYGIKPSLFARKDIHIHLPEGAVPKDGPSAGIGMVTSIVSTLTGGADPPRDRDDRRGHAARPGVADRRIEGKTAGGVARRDRNGADSAGE